MTEVSESMLPEATEDATNMQQPIKAGTLESLVKGHKVFRRNYYQSGNQILRPLIEQAQSPQHLILTCSDAFIDPCILLDCPPSELMVHRNLASIIPPYRSKQSDRCTSAALEMAVCEKRVSSIIILSHNHCASIDHLLSKETLNKQESHIDNWLSQLKTAKKQVDTANEDMSLSEKSDTCSKLSALISLKNLYGYPFIKQAVELGELNCYAWYFDIESGYISSFNSERGEFELLR